MIKRRILLLAFLALVTSRQVIDFKKSIADRTVEKLSEEVLALKQMVFEQADIINDLQTYNTNHDTSIELVKQTPITYIASIAAGFPI